MGLFAKLRAATGKLAEKGRSLFKTHEPLQPHFRGKESAETHAEGQAARRQKLLERRVESGESAQVYENYKNLQKGESPYLEDFLDGFAFTQFASSNVYAVVYDRTRFTLYVQYLRKKNPGPWYQYKQVDLSEAKTVYNAISKGIWVWSNLRVRGSQTQNKKPTTKVSGPPGYLPLGRKRTNILEY